jgi:hypothetical protein
MSASGYSKLGKSNQHVTTNYYLKIAGSHHIIKTYYFSGLQVCAKHQKPHKWWGICQSIKTGCNDRYFVRNTRDNTEDYKQKRNDATKICIKKKRKMVSNEIVCLQNKNNKMERRKLHKNVNYLPT